MFFLYHKNWRIVFQQTAQCHCDWLPVGESFKKVSFFDSPSSTNPAIWTRCVSKNQFKLCRNYGLPQRQALARTHGFGFCLKLLGLLTIVSRPIVAFNSMCSMCPIQICSFDWKRLGFESFPRQKQRFGLLSLLNFRAV